jgi:elongator complex protein 6
MERQHAALAGALSHQAHHVISVRPLQSGTATDVSGVVRITGGGAISLGQPGDEYLYVVGIDGKVKPVAGGV